MWGHKEKREWERILTNKPHIFLFISLGFSLINDKQRRFVQALLIQNIKYIELALSAIQKDCSNKQLPRIVMQVFLYQIER
jgi:hypothetical protein